MQYAVNAFNKVSTKIEILLGSAIALFILKYAHDLPYNVPCNFFFGEPEYPTDKM